MATPWCLWWHHSLRPTAVPVVRRSAVVRCSAVPVVRDTSNHCLCRTSRDGDLCAASICSSCHHCGPPTSNRQVVIRIEHIYIFLYMSKASGVHLGTLSLLHEVVEAYLALWHPQNRSRMSKKLIRGPFSFILLIFQV